MKKKSMGKIKQTTVRSRWIAASTGIALTVLVAGCGTGGASSSGQASGNSSGGTSAQYPVKQLTMASQDFSEPLIDDYMMKDLIEAKTPIKVTIKQTSGASGLMHTMMLSNAIQIYTGYDGTEFAGPLKQSYTGKFKGHPNLVSQYVVDQEMKQWNIWVSPSLGYEDTYALAVTQATAKKDHLKTVSDAIPYAKNWVLGTDPTFQARKGDGLADFEKDYGIQFKSAKAMSYDLMYQALANNAVQAAVSYSTDGRLKKLHEVPLVDNKHFFPPYHAVALINDKVFQEDHLGPILKPLWGVITTADQTELNYEVDVLKKDPATVARDFLVSKGLLSK
ncbi:hypothetical protein LLE49_18645 [Alicyclobacillus tolerans]|uniref:ABC transporter substrate-binding protein n=1 Tax=Alicyclobacillus tolerans TaxID=90970 RepID=UPI001F3D4BF1|nr:glycine betaine ABC transporter substrate-binding protein [Alicyclobacillus tolerans]MCF8566746.1 hypothetical protein [Alicyclobacillus tolerans]